MAEREIHSAAERQRASEAAAAASEVGAAGRAAAEATARAEQAEVAAATARDQAARTEEVSHTMMLSTQQEGLSAINALVELKQCVPAGDPTRFSAVWVGDGWFVRLACGDLAAGLVSPLIALLAVITAT